MHHTNHGATLLASALTIGLIASSAAQACPAKDIVGTWDDEYGSVAKITSETKGTATASTVVCSAAGTIYKLTIKLSGGASPTTAKVVGRAPKSSGCPVVKATLKYKSGSCTVASGPVKFDGTSIEDTWTKQSGAVQADRESRTQGSSLFNGLK
jgi:hypothetical protein